MTLSAYQAELGGVVIGSGTDYAWEVEPSGLGTGEYRGSRLASPWSHGSRPQGPDLLDPKRIVFDVEIVTGSGYAAGGTLEVEDLLEALAGAWQPVQSGTVDLTLRFAGGERIVRGRPLGCEKDLTGALFGRARARCTFEALDPRFYASAESSATVGLTTGGTLSPPLTVPVILGAGSDSDVSVTNQGTFETPWTAAIRGPVTTPRLTLASTGEYVELDGVVPDGSLLVLDSADESILLDGSSRAGWLTLPSRWWVLPAGTHTIRYRAAAGTGQCTVAFRSAWI